MSKPRKTTITTSISLSPDLMRRIRRAAAQDDRNVSNWIAHTLTTRITDIERHAVAEERPSYDTKPKDK